MPLFPACEHLKTIWLARVRSILNPLKPENAKEKKQPIFDLTHLRSPQSAS